MRQIADWLDKLGMSEYAQRFAENGISVAALRHLTDQDLKDIGVLLGHRRLMLAAIASLNDMPAGAASAQVAVSTPQSIAVLAHWRPNPLANAGMSQSCSAIL
jgi:SAM domain (Sterile alpha motif)